jgi:putative inorganic carbon (HCO3(-)) transporter
MSMSTLDVIDAPSCWWRREPQVEQSAAVAEGSRLAFWALIAFTGILILSPQVWFPALRSLRIAFLAAALAIGAHLLDQVVRRRPGVSHRETLIAFCLVGWAVLTVPLSYWPGGSIGTLTEHFLKAVAFFWLIGAVVTTERRLRAFLWLLVVCSIPLSVTAIQNYQSGVFLQTPLGANQRIAGFNIGGSGLTANPNDLALMLNLIIPFSAAMFVISRSLFARLVAALSLLLGSVAVILTFSRAGFLTLATLGVLGLFAVGRRRPLAAVAVAAVLAATPAFLPAGYMDRLSTITDISADPTGSAQGRWSDLTVAVGVVGSNPITGVGLGQNVIALNQQRGETWREIHNVYLQYAVDLGIAGLALFLWLFVSLIRTVSRVRRESLHDPARRSVAVIAASVRGALLAFAVAAFFHPVAYQFYFFCIAGLAIAVSAVAARADRAVLALEPAA